MKLKKAQEVSLKVETADVISFVSQVFYSREHDVFVRELVQNAFDAITIRQKKTGPNLSGLVRVSLEAAQNRISVEDNGWGLDEVAIRDNLLKILSGLRRNAGAREALQDDFDEIIGRFGAGLMSCFRVAHRIELETKRERGKAWQVTLVHEPATDAAPDRYRAFLLPSIRTRVGTEVRVQLAPGDGQKGDNVSKIAGPELLRAALYSYVKHPPNGIKVVLAVDGVEEEILPSPFLGQTGNIYQEIDQDAVFGYIGIGPSLDSQLRVCQNGILVRDNYQSLLPENCLAIYGEINVATSTVVQLKPSREEYIENEDFQQLKDIVAQGVARLDEFLARSVVQVFTAPEKEQRSENSAEAIAWLRLYLKGGIAKNIIKHKILSAVKFKFVTTGKDLLLEEIEAYARKHNYSQVFVYTINRSIVDDLSCLGDFKLFIQNSNEKLAVDLLKARGAAIVELMTISDHEERISFKEVVMDYLKSRDLTAVDLSDTIDITNMGLFFGSANLPQKLQEAGLEVPPGDERLRQIFPDFKAVSIPGGQRAYRNTKNVWVNTAHPDIQQILARWEDEVWRRTRDQEIKRYLQLITLNFQAALDGILADLDGKEGL